MKCALEGNVLITGTSCVFPSPMFWILLDEQGTCHGSYLYAGALPLTLQRLKETLWA